MVEGGFNGGGWASNYYVNEILCGSGGGGGATDLRFEENDLYHRVIVAGGGGGPDNPGVKCGEPDDGSGGAGGGLIAQGFNIDGVENTILRATQESGFTFGYGESARKEGSLNSENTMQSYGSSDRSGAGGGWFGGFASHNGNAGAGGGSSFILAENASIPVDEIESRDSFYENTKKQKYAFLDQTKYLFSSTKMYKGVWKGSGFAIITQLSANFYCTKSSKFFSLNVFVYIFCLV